MATKTQPREPLLKRVKRMASIGRSESAPPAADAKTIVFTGPEALRPQWDMLVEKCTTELGPTSALALNTLNTLVFGGGNLEVIENCRGSQTAYKQFRTDIELTMLKLSDMCKHDDTMWALRDTMLASLATQWVQLEKLHKLFPPQSINRATGIDEDEINQIRKKRSGLVQSLRGGILMSGLRSACDWQIELQADRLERRYVKSGKAERQQIVELAEHQFHQALFLYDPKHGVPLGAYIQIGLDEYIGKKVHAKFSKIPSLRSIDAPAGRDKEKGIAETLVDENSPDAVQGGIKSEYRKRIKDAMRVLDPRSREVLSLLYGLEDGVTRTLDEVGQLVRNNETGEPLTRERIRQIEAKALGKILPRLADLGDEIGVPISDEQLAPEPSDSEDKPWMKRLRGIPVEQEDTQLKELRLNLRAYFADTKGNDVPLRQIAILTGVSEKTLDQVMGDSEKAPRTSQLGKGLQDKLVTALRRMPDISDKDRDAFIADFKALKDHVGKQVVVGVA